MKAIALSSPGVVGARPSKASEERIWVAVVSLASAMGGVAEGRAAVRFESAAQPARRAAQKAGASKERSGKSGLPVSKPHARRSWQQANREASLRNGLRPAMSKCL